MSGTTSVDVANEAGVSQATVTRTFSSPELVSGPTREKVLAAAERLGYVPNAIARSLKSQRTNIIGAVVPTVGEYWQHVLTAFSRQLAARGLQLLLFSFSEADRVDAVLESVRQYRVDGLILASSRISQAQLAQTQLLGLPLVAFNQPAASGVVPSVCVDNEAGTRLLAGHLVEQGCSTVLFVGGASAASTDQIRYRGAAQELGRHGVALPYVAAGDFSYEAGYKIAGRLVQDGSGELPDALMIAGDELAFGVIDGLASSGVRAPADVLVTGFDGLPQTQWAAYDLTTLVQSTDSLVERAVGLLLDQVENSSVALTKPAPDVVVAGSIRPGRTTEPAKDPSKETHDG